MTKISNTRQVSLVLFTGLENKAFLAKKLSVLVCKPLVLADHNLVLTLEIGQLFLNRLIHLFNKFDDPLELTVHFCVVFLHRRSNCIVNLGVARHVKVCVKHFHGVRS